MLSFGEIKMCEENLKDLVQTPDQLSINVFFGKIKAQCIAFYGPETADNTVLDKISFFLFLLQFMYLLYFMEEKIHTKTLL